MDTDSLIDRIYEAAAFPAEWPAVLHDFAHLVEGAGAMLLTRRSDSWIGWSLSPAVAQAGDRYLRSPAATLSRTTSKLIGANRAGFIADHELFAEDEYLSDPMMSNWGTPNGFHHGAATGIHTLEGDYAIVQIQRRTGQPRLSPDDLARLDVMRPHLARAAMLAARWRLERLRAMTDALAMIGLAAAILDQDGGTIAANDLVQRQNGLVAWLPGDRLELRDPTASETLKRGLAGMRLGAGACTFPVSQRNGSKPAIAHLIPTPRQARDLFSGGLGLLVLSSFGAGSPPSADLIQSLYDLTRAEAEVADALGRGLSVREIAHHREVSYETVRNQVKALLLKTGVSRQAELLVMMSSIPRLAVTS